jgi:hypothetical protein
MAEMKKKTYRSTAFTPSPKPAKKETADTRQVVLTLSVPDGEVIKIEKLDKDGKRQPMPEAEFAALAGDDDAEDLGAVLEGAYTAGISDALNDEISEEEEDTEDEEEIVRRFMLRRAAGRQLLRAGLRKFILRRRLRREVMQRRTKSESNGRSQGAKH